MADLSSLHLPVMDHSLGAVTNVTAASIPHDALRQLLVRRPHLNAPFWRDTLVDAAIFREWVANVGRRPAYQDDEGMNFPDASSARDAAIGALPEMTRDKIPDGDRLVLAVRVRDEGGALVYSATLDLAGEWHGQQAGS